MTVHASVLELIGNTPMVDVSLLSPNPDVRIVAKLEGQNPAGSVKDRIAWAMVQEAEADGTLSPGRTIIEPSSGNTGIALAMIARTRGYPIKIVMPENVSIERRQALAVWGAEIVVPPGAEGPHGAVRPAPALAGEVPELARLRCSFHRQSDEIARPLQDGSLLVGRCPIVAEINVEQRDQIRVVGVCDLQRPGGAQAVPPGDLDHAPAIGTVDQHQQPAVPRHERRQQGRDHGSVSAHGAQASEVGPARGSVRNGSVRPVYSAAPCRWSRRRRGRRRRRCSPSSRPCSRSSERSSRRSSCSGLRREICSAARAPPGACGWRTVPIPPPIIRGSATSPRRARAGGWPVARGGSGAIPDALAASIAEHGGNYYPEDTMSINFNS